MEIETLMKKFAQFSSGVVHPWETVLEIDEDADDGSIIWTKKFKLYLNEEGRQLLNKTEQSEEQKNQWKFYQNQEALEKDTLKRKKEMIL